MLKETVATWYREQNMLWMDEFMTKWMHKRKNWVYVIVVRNKSQLDRGDKKSEGGRD